MGLTMGMVAGVVATALLFGTIWIGRHLHKDKN